MNAFDSIRMECDVKCVLFYSLSVRYFTGMLQYNTYYLMTDTREKTVTRQNYEYGRYEVKRWSSGLYVELSF